MTQAGEKFFGKYRGIVTDNQDPLKIGRIRANVPDVFGDYKSAWALPCAPFAGKGLGFFALPTVGTGVWIEFEHGDPEYPIWSGAWWGSSNEMAQELTSPEQQVVIKTEHGQMLFLDDTKGQGEITIQTAGGQKIVLNDEGITLSTQSGQKIEIKAATIKLDNGAAATVELSGPKVSLNQSALEVI